MLAGFLGVFLGFLGIHNFYLGNDVRGSLQLLLSVLTLGYGLLVTIPWGVIEGLLILLGSIDTDARGRRLGP